MQSHKPSSNRPLNLRQIEVFHAIMSTGSISAAGRLLFVSQPAVSRTLAAAEAKLGYPLFERSKGRLYPTREARKLFAEVSTLYSGITRVNDLAVNLADDRSTVLRVVSSPTFGEMVIPRALLRFRAEQPGVRVKYLPMTMDNMLPQVLNGHTDVALSMLPPIQHPELSMIKVDATQVVCVVHRSHPLARLSTIKPEHLRGQPLISYAPETSFGMVLAGFLKASQDPVVVDIEVRSSVTALNLARQGLGLALVDPYGITPDALADVVALPLRPMVPLSAHLIYAVQESRSNLVATFVRALRAVIRERDSLTEAV